MVSSNALFSTNFSILQSNSVVESTARRLHRYQYIFDTLRMGLMSDGTGYWKDETYRNVVRSLDCPSPNELTDRMREDKETEMISLLEQKCRKEILSLEDCLNVISAAFTLSSYLISTEMKRLSWNEQNAVMKRYNELYKNSAFNTSSVDKSLIQSPFLKILQLPNAASSSFN
ncbi:hypothetical protein K435DRAFT_866602 [Dendrothele bispora CBS 962.96]|uniref:Uncharacterized protein n=1 Tax=Dendrothele bispora (strain CBS 962.96) TaxID=1314807 RepID=A0A4S8LGG2_DENBC|nr:hypothetical protein K435DRAFT_866602 [Dendrothele bispora CBS 962.96]